MEFALHALPFDTLTVVDSDQLSTRPGYSEYLSAFMNGRTGLGMLVNAPGVQPSQTRVGPAVAAHQEFELWRPFLRRFPDGEQKFAHWSFWPSSIFTADAAHDLVNLFRNDRQLCQIMERTRIWASEEVILPTLTALLGYEIAPNPCSYEYVRYRMPVFPRGSRCGTQPAGRLLDASRSTPVPGSPARPSPVKAGPILTCDTERSPYAACHTLETRTPADLADPGADEDDRRLAR